MITNIHLAKTLAGKRLEQEEIKVGVVVTFPSGFSGVMNYHCISVDQDEAVFEPVDKESRKYDWNRYVIKFNAPDLSLAELKELVDAMEAFNSWRLSVSDSQRSLVCRAAALGYVSQMSYTQVSWTDEGLARVKAKLSNDQ